MTGAILGLGAVLLAAALAAVVWQHLRYLRRRRGPVEDRQPLLYGSSALHVVTLAKSAPGADLFVDARRLVTALESAAGARVVYAGKCLVVGAQSRQLPAVDWDFALVCQHPSRAAYQAARRLPAVASALATLERSYDQGMQRKPFMNLAIPLLLLARRVADLLRRQPARYPFEPAGPSAGPEAQQRARLADGLRKQTELGRDAVVVVNFIEHGTPEQRSQDSAYVSAMMGLMAERGYGPTHMGRALTLEGDAHFHDVALVYYPGVEYFAEMAQSTFFGGIIGGKQLGDTLAIITAPFLERLRAVDEARA